MPTDTLFKQLTVEENHLNDAPNWTVGVRMSGTPSPLSLDAVWWSPPVDAAGAVSWRIYSNDVGASGALLGGDTLGAYIVGGGWQRFAIPSIDVSGITFLVCLTVSATGHYAFRTGLFPVNDGILSSPGGCFKEGSDARPDVLSAASFMIDGEVSYGVAPSGKGRRFFSLLGDV
jgi:hypothetical protein